MKKKVEKYCLINDEKLDKDINELQDYVILLVESLSKVTDPNKYRKMMKLKREAESMIDELRERKLLNHENDVE